MAYRRVIKLIKKVKEFDIEAAVIEIVNENQEIITQLLKDQLRQGLDGDGKPVTVFNRPFYSLETIERKSQITGLGGETEYITNYMSGAFYNFMRVKFEGDAFEVWSDVEYFKEIIAQSGSVIMKLSHEHVEYLKNNIILPRLKVKYQQYLNGI